MLTRLHLLLLGTALIATACGSGNNTPDALFDDSVPTGLPPTISTVTPAAASIAGGTVVTLSGFGFSSTFPNNIITLTNGTTSATVSATSYSLVAAATATDIEAITFTIPATAPVGVLNVFVTVLGNTSNANLALTVTP